MRQRSMYAAGIVQFPRGERKAGVVHAKMQGAERDGGRAARIGGGETEGKVTREGERTVGRCAEQGERKRWDTHAMAQEWRRSGVDGEVRK